MTGHPFLSEVAPITGPMYQLFIFFMITDPKTTVRSRSGASAWSRFSSRRWRRHSGCCEWVHAPYYALFLVGPAANLIEIAFARHVSARAGQLRPTPSASATRLM